MYPILLVARCQMAVLGGCELFWVLGVSNGERIEGSKGRRSSQPHSALTSRCTDASPPRSAASLPPVPPDAHPSFGVGATRSDTLRSTPRLGLTPIKKQVRHSRMPRDRKTVHTRTLKGPIPPRIRKKHRRQSSVAELLKCMIVNGVCAFRRRVSPRLYLGIAFIRRLPLLPRQH